MPWYRAELRVSEDQALGRLAGLPGAFSLRDEGHLFLGAFPSARSHAVDPEERGGSSRVGEEGGRWPQWVGVLPYEAFRHWERRNSLGGDGDDGDPRRPPLCHRPIWQRYDAVARLTGDSLLLQGTSSEAMDRLGSALAREAIGRPLATPSLAWAESPEADELHIRRVEAALECIARGELYQVNLARRFCFHVCGDPISLLQSLGAAAQAPFAAALDLGDLQVVSTSPELFLDLTPEGRLSTRPVKGTRPRHPDPLQDARLGRELDASEKERAELAMVIDLERNDLGRLAQTGTVKMISGPSIVSHPTVHHREALIEAKLLPGISRRTVLDTMMPSGSITGAPKVAAMGLIAELESHRRGLYTGALGYLTYGAAMRLSMAIRVLTIRGRVGHYFAGGGIVADSDPALELQETIWKTEQLRALVAI